MSATHSLAIALLAGLASSLAACVNVPEGPCLPGGATFSTVNGDIEITDSGTSFTFTHEDTSETGGPCSVYSRESDSGNADEHSRITLQVRCEQDGELISFGMEVEDTRDLELGSSEHRSDNTGLRIHYRPDASSRECYTNLVGDAYQIEVLQGVGGFAPHPQLVSEDFYREIRVRLDLDLDGVNGTHWDGNDLSDCKLNFQGSLQFIAEIEAGSYASEPADSCVYE